MNTATEKQAMSDQVPVNIELHHEISQFLYEEARMLDRYELRGWLDSVVDPDVRYRMVMREERFASDRRPPESAELFIYDDTLNVLEMRVRQFESGLQTMLDPIQRIRRVISNISAYRTDEENAFRVLSYGNASRFRRLYEAEQVVFAREDTLRRDGDGKLRLLTRKVELDERVSRNKNILFFL